MIANPSMRWMTAFIMASLGCTLVGSVITNLTTDLVLSPVYILTRVLPSVAIALFLPFAILSFALLKLDRWTAGGFGLGAALIPLIVFGIIWILVDNPGPNFVSGFLGWVASAVVAGLIFHRVWESLS
jgi:ABC-type methionine transport system permease subunit